MTLEEIYRAAYADEVFFVEYSGMPAAAGDRRDLAALADEAETSEQEMLDTLSSGFAGAIVDLCVPGDMHPTREERCMSAWEAFEERRARGSFPRLASVRESLGLPVHGTKPLGTF